MRIKRTPYLRTNWARDDYIIWPDDEGVAEMEFETELIINDRAVRVRLEQVCALQPDGDGHTSMLK